MKLLPKSKLPISLSSGLSLLVVGMLGLGTLITIQQVNDRSLKNVQGEAAFDPATRTFSETFTANPASPQPFNSPSWDIQVHERGMVKRPAGEQNAMAAQHGVDCGAPPANHNVHTSDDSVFNCKDHIMTSLNGDEYGVIYLTPNAMLDWSGGQAVLTFDLSTEKMSTRDWWDVTVSPFTDAQALPLRSDLSDGVDLQGPNKNSIVVATDNGEGAPNLNVIRNGAITRYNQTSPRPGDGITAGTNQAATRQPFRLTIESNRVKFERLASATAPALVFFDRTFSPALTWNQGVIQLGHHSYDPFKDGAGVAATWHWDNVVLTPSTPFTMLPVSQRYVYNNNTTQTLTFPAAPAGSILRFSSAGRPVINGIAQNPLVNGNHPETMGSYNVPIPTGATSATISFTNQDWYDCGFGCMAKDFKVWSLNTVGGTPIPTTAATNTPTPTTAQATATPTQTPTPTPLPTNTPTPTPQPKTGVLRAIPSVTSIKTGQTVTVDVLADSGSQLMNAVEAVISYPTNLLQFQSINTTNSAFSINALETVNNGTITLARGTSTPISGSGRLVATITFKALTTTGTANISFNTGASSVVSSVTNQNILNTTQGTSITITQAVIGDLNNDNQVNIFDLSILLTNFGTTNVVADVNNDGQVNIFDLSVLLSNFGQ